MDPLYSTKKSKKSVFASHYFLLEFSSLSEYLLFICFTVKYILTQCSSCRMTISVCCIFQGGIHLYVIVNDYVDRLLFTLIIISTVPFLVGYSKCLFMISYQIFYLQVKKNRLKKNPTLCIGRVQF